MSRFMVWSSMADERCRDKLRGCSGKSIHGSRYREGAIWVQDLLVLGGDPVNSGVAGNVGDQDGFVIEQVLSKAFIGPSIHQGLDCGVFRPVLWKVNQQRNLNMIGKVAPGLDLRVAVMEGSALGQVPKCVHEVVGVPLDIEVMFCPEAMQSRQLLDVHCFCQFE